MRLALAFVCAATLFAANADSESFSIPPLHVAAGAVVTFHVQSRLRSGNSDAPDVVPAGTALQVKFLDSIDSARDRDGSTFRGTLVSAITSGSMVIPVDSEVHGILVLLRSKTHPDGFRYELIVTSIVTDGHSHPLTASLHASLFEAASSPAPHGAQSNSGGTP